MELNELRKEIDKVNARILELFIKRMTLAKGVADYKKEHNLPVFQKGREDEILSYVRENSPEEMKDCAALLFTTLFDLSRAYQTRLGAGECLNDGNFENDENWENKENKANKANGEKSSNSENQSPSAARKAEILRAKTSEVFPSSARVACQGVPGAYSGIAAKQMFSSPEISYLEKFDDVFEAVSLGKCDFGVLPIENSLHGIVNRVYDLLEEYRFFIVRAFHLGINHTLLAPHGSSLCDITDIYSHEMALGQCSRFLRANPQIKPHICENTAKAAEFVSKENNPHFAAISASDCASLYSLSEVSRSIADSGHNFTRFICISKNLKIYGGANKVSLILSTLHRPGALYSLLSRFAAGGVNIKNLESRPKRGTDFEYRFYFDLDASLENKEEAAVIFDALDSASDAVFLGNYEEKRQ